MIFPNVTCTAMDYSRANGKSIIPNVCAYFECPKVYSYLDGTKENELLIFYNDEGRKGSFFLPSNILYDYPQLMKACSIKQMPIHDFICHDMSFMLVNRYRELLNLDKIEYRHSQLGWHNTNQGTIFLFDNTPYNNARSICVRSMSFSNGDRKTYLDLIESQILPRKELTLAYMFGFSAVVSSRLNMDECFGTIIINICGKSSIGKTTVEHLLVSPFADPAFSKTGLVHTFNATQNALIGQIDGIHGLPIVLDDITTCNWPNYSELLYTLASGENKARCNQNGNVRKDSNGWDGLIVISSETPIIEDALQNQGLKARVINTEGIQWTPDAKTSELIKKTVLQNYGFLGKEYISYIEKMDIHTLQERRDECFTKVRECALVSDGLTDRLYSKIAIIRLSAELFAECFNYDIDVDGIIELLIQSEQNGAKTRDIIDESFEVMKTFIFKNYNHFDRRTNGVIDFKAQGTCFGIINQISKEKYHISIPVDTVKETLIANGYKEIATIKNGWRDRGYTMCDKNRNDIKASVKEISCRCIRFEMDIPKDNTNAFREGQAYIIDDSKCPHLGDDKYTYRKMYGLPLDDDYDDRLKTANIEKERMLSEPPIEETAYEDSAFITNMMKEGYNE